MLLFNYRRTGICLYCRGELGLDAAPPYWYCCRYNYLTDEWEEAPPMPRTHPYVTTFTKDNAGYVIFNDIAYKFVY